MRGLLVHMFAGESRKEVERLGKAKGYEVISIGEGEDIASPQTSGYLLRLAACGKVDVWWGAPPCSTNCLCRFVQPGPRPLRGHSDETRWGLKDLTDKERQVRRSDEPLLMHVEKEGKERLNESPPWSLIENPQDPDTYVDPSSKLWQASRDQRKLPSFYATREFKKSAELLDLQLHRGDQGPYGHVRRKPTTWASNKQLPMLRKGPGPGMEADSVDSTHEGWASARWAKWAPGMLQLLVEQLPCGDDESCKLAQAEGDWETHLKNGHWPRLGGAKFA